MKEKELCMMCTEYSSDAKCENKNDCKLLGILKENKLLKNKNKELARELADARLKMSYMVDPNAIGNRW